MMSRMFFSFWTNSIMPGLLLHSERYKDLFVPLMPPVWRLNVLCGITQVSTLVSLLHLFYGDMEGSNRDGETQRCLWGRGELGWKDNWEQSEINLDTPDGLKCVWVCVCLYIFLYLLHSDCQHIHSSNKVRTFLVRKEILAGSRIFKGLFEGKAVVLRLGL